ncbi:hypothetical protein, partial [Mycolicibacterium sp.]|uniref:hypothetical protein n=1 Tax=Mycolicibacterium sp. TaxID=2320850 RepID=UPI0037C8CAA3
QVKPISTENSSRGVQTQEDTSAGEVQITPSSHAPAALGAAMLGGCGVPVMRVDRADGYRDGVQRE